MNAAPSAGLGATLGILAGGGVLPARVAEARAAHGRSSSSGCRAMPRAGAGAVSHVMIRLGAIGEILGALRGQGCRDLVLVGPVERPRCSIFAPMPRARG